MVSKLALLVCALCAARTLAVTEWHHSGRQLKQIGVDCILNQPSGAVASVSANVQAFGGTVSVHITASGEAVEEAADAIAIIVAEAIVDVAEGEDAIAVADGAAEAVGKAVAEAYAEVVAELISTGPDNIACAEGFASATATATAFARAIIEVLAQASNVISFASADGAAEALAVATASAFAEAEVAACGAGVFEITAVASTLATAIAMPVAEVFGVAFALVSGTSALGQILVEAASDTVVVTVLEGTSIVEVVGEGEATSATSSGTCTNQQDLCGLRFFGCCGDRRIDCACGVGCEARPADFGTDNIIGYQVIESDQSIFPPPPPVGTVCFCPF